MKSARTPFTESRGLRPSRQAGFTLLELVVALAIMVIIAATITPALVGTLDAARIDQAKQSLASFATAVSEFHGDTNNHPGALTHLSGPITASQTNSCGSTYPPGQAAMWKGPYVDRTLTTAGVPIGVGTVQDQLVRDPPSQGSQSSGGGRTGQAGFLRMVVTGVRESDAIALDREVDADGSNAAGTIQWSLPPDAQGMVTLWYVVPINGC